MPRCVKCDGSEADNDAIVSCDKCRRNYCQGCSTLTSTEVRAINLKSRTVKYFCLDCCPNQDSADLGSNINTSRSASENPSYVGEIISFLKPLYDKISALETEVKVLKDSNLDLIRLLTEKPELIRGHKTKSQDTADVNTCSIDQDINYANKLKGAIHYNASGRSKTENSFKGAEQSSSSKNTKLTGSSSQHALVETNEEFTLVKSRRNRYPRKVVNIGTAEVTPENNAFAGRNVSGKKAWLFISRVRDTATEETVKSYIMGKTGTNEDEVSVKQVDTTYKRKDSKCFQVGIKFDLKDRLYEDGFWPGGVAFRRFRFNFGENEKPSSLNGNRDSFLG